MEYRIIESIKEKLNENKLNGISEKIDAIIASGSTGGEITAMTGKFLLDLVVENEEYYKIIGREVEEFIRYANGIGIRIS